MQADLPKLVQFSGKTVAALPLIERELRVALRKLNPRRRRLVTAGWAVGITGLLILLAAATGSRELGSNVHTVLLVFGLFALWSVPGRIAGAIAEERRNQTLGILFISGLSAMDIFAGKLLSAVLIAFNDLLVIFPLLALPFIMGGVSFELFIATICCLPNVLLFVLAVSLFASTVTKDEASAQTWTTVLMLIICGLAPAIWVGQKWFAGATVQSPWLAMSPAYGVFLVFTKFSGASAHVFWMNWVATLGWSVALLIGAAGLLQRIWRSDENANQTSQRSWWQQRVDSVVNRQRDSSRWMIESNPALWAEIADTRPLKLAWTAIGVVLGIWLLGWAAWPAQWPSVPNFFITTTLLIALVQVIQNYATAKRFALARRDGTFELLLTTPLSAGEFVHGHLEGRRVQFRPVVFCLLLLELVMALAGLLVRPWTPPALITYFAVWIAIVFWTWAMHRGEVRAVRVGWVALNSARINFAMWDQNGKWGRVWMIYYLWTISRGLRRVNSFPSGSPAELCFVGVIFIIFCIAFLTRQKSRSTTGLDRLIDEFRDIIREPIPDPDDPRFGKWKQPWNERFPWGPVAFQDRVVERAARRRRAEQIKHR